jgi:hypothetical protein
MLFTDREAVVSRQTHFELKHVLSAKSHQLGYPVYPFSIVAGGVHSPEDLSSAMAKDPTVRAHYADIDPLKVRFVRTTEDRFEYVSYRRGDRVFWTPRRLLIPKGELLLTDGHAWARSRCGNRLSDSSQSPEQTEFAPPSDFVLNSVVSIRPLPLGTEIEVAKNVPPPTESPSLEDERLATLAPAFSFDTPTLTLLTPDGDFAEVPQAWFATGQPVFFGGPVSSEARSPGTPSIRRSETADTPQTTGVPEPGSLPLTVSAALLALGLWRAHARHKKATPPSYPAYPSCPDFSIFSAPTYGCRDFGIRTVPSAC